jgi:hypothetical protein
MIHLKQLRYYTMAVLLILLLSGSAASQPRQAEANPAGAASFTIGHSVQGHAIEALRIGEGPRSIVLVGSIHGSEGNTTILVNSLVEHLTANLHLFPPDISVYLIPTLNPDGLAAGTRYNANGVDLNRNWDTPNWQADTYDAAGRRAGGGGAHPFSEPETAAMAGWLLALREQSSSVTVVFYHSAYPPSGLVLGGSVGEPLTPAYASVVGYSRTVPGRPGWTAYPVTGVAPHWCGTQDIGCFEIEMPSHAAPGADAIQKHATAVISVLMLEQYAPDQRCFLETGWCVSGRIRQFWERHGGLNIFGMPLTRQYEEVIDGVPRQVQWFERNRLELHPEHTPPYDVLLGRIGAERLEQQGRNWWTFAAGDAAAAEASGCRFFAETGHAICGEMLAAWQANGLELDGQRGTSEAESLALFGMPLSEAQPETLADGQTYLVQWFERARFELHPREDGSSSVLLGLLGSEMRQAEESE